MPCGGIFPISDIEFVEAQDSCFYCGELGSGPWSFVEEWDANIHDRCVDGFLKTPEGQVVVNHEHEIFRRVP